VVASSGAPLRIGRARRRRRRLRDRSGVIPRARVVRRRGASAPDAGAVPPGLRSASPVLLLCVSRDETLLSLVHRLVTATYFEDAATAALQAMFACAEEALAGSVYATGANSGRILR